MRKTLLGLGIIILFVGVIVFSISNQFVEKPVNKLVNRVKNLPYEEWKISAQFNESEELLVMFTRPNVEGVPNGDIAIATIFVSINDPNDGNTTFQIDFKRTDVNITLLSKAEGLIVNDPPVNVGGVTRYNGNYTAYLYTYAEGLADYYYSNALLPTLELYKIDAKRDYPHSGFLPVGLTLLVVGACLSVWGAKSSKYSSKLQRKHKLAKET